MRNCNYARYSVAQKWVSGTTSTKITTSLLRLISNVSGHWLYVDFFSWLLFSGFKPARMKKVIPNYYLVNILSNIINVWLFTVVGNYDFTHFHVTRNFITIFVNNLDFHSFDVICSTIKQSVIVYFYFYLDWFWAVAWKHLLWELIEHYHVLSTTPKNSNHNLLEWKQCFLIE